MQTGSNPSVPYTPGSLHHPMEIVRLTQEHLIVKTAMGGTLADIPAGTALKTVLDIASGPGDWVLDVAADKPELEVVGVDFDKNMIQYARSLAQSQNLKNVLFQEMNWTLDFDFSANSFDLVNGRLLILLLPREKWAGVLKNAFRILRPGGVLRLVDSDHIMTSSWAIETLHHWTIRALKQLSLGFSPTGRTLGSSPVLPALFRQAGFVDVKLQPYCIDFSAGTERWGALYRNMEMIFKKLMTLVVTMEIASQQNFDEVFSQMHTDILSSDFCGNWPIFSVVGVKPLS